MQKLLILDYDNTVANPKSSPSPATLGLLVKLLENNKVAILTGGRSIKRLKELIILNTELNGSPLLKNLYMCPEYGNIIFTWDNDWFVVYESPDITERALRGIERILRRMKWKKYILTKTSKKRIYDKGSVISINCLGNDATDEEKENWDKSGENRKGIKKELEKKLGRKYDIFITGRNTIDIVPKGTNKADNLLRLLDITSTKIEDSIYIGDEFNPDGNDYPILSLNIKIYQVKDPSETESILRSYI